MATTQLQNFSVEEFLDEDKSKDLLRFSTAGSVDDGKSTLIGRLLYDTQSVYEDQVRSIEGKGTTAPGQIDFALLTDGLRAEREQGITIDVAYRYFATRKRKFIIADTPGHEQYTRNMATGASTADAAVVLLDASKGVLIQSRRHAYIASLLKVRHVLVAVNKMDLVGYSEPRFNEIVADFQSVLDAIATDTGNRVEARFIPVSALAGDNVVHRSEATRWYKGPSLLELLESIPVGEDESTRGFRFPVQRVIRPNHTFRGFAGQIASGRIKVGDAITALPSKRSAKIERIVTFNGDLTEAEAPLSVVLVLDREIDISRGDLIAAEADEPTITRELEAALVWMDERPLDVKKRYLLKHTSHTVPAFVSAVKHVVDLKNFSDKGAAKTFADKLELNAIGAVTVNLLRPIAVDLYSENRSTGAFILIDPTTNGTVAAGMIRATVADTTDDAGGSEEDSRPVTAIERAARRGHEGAILNLSGVKTSIDKVERALFAGGVVTLRVEKSDFSGDARILAAVTEAGVKAGLLVLVTDTNDGEPLVAEAAGKKILAEEGNSGGVQGAVLRLLRETGLIHEAERLGL